jgi:hypothetical protein
MGESPEDGLLEMAFYRYLRLDGDLAPALEPAVGTLRFTTQGQMLFPFFEADPQEGPTLPYHMYFRRREPEVVFGRVEAGVPNTVREDGLTFLDVVWDRAPFADHARFVAAVEEEAAAWREAGRYGPEESAAVVAAARRAEADLAV